MPIVQNPHVKLTKAATVPGGTADAAGEVIDYTITVENDGNMTLTNPVVSDPSTTGVTGVDADNDTFNDGDTNLDGASLGETWHYTASHEVTQEEMDAGGTIDNTASVTTDQEATADGSASVTVEQRAGLTLEKMGTFVDGESEPNGYADVGETVHYTFTIENDGNVTLSNLVLTDLLGLELIGPTGDATSMACSMSARPGPSRAMTGSPRTTLPPAPFTTKRRRPPRVRCRCKPRATLTAPIRRCRRRSRRIPT